MFIACDTDANQPDISKPDESEPEEAKTSISVTLGFQDIEETGSLSLEVTILKGKDTIETFTLTSEKKVKTIEVEAGEYTVVTTLLESGVPPKTDTYFCSLVDETVTIKEGDTIKFVATISKGGTEPGGEGESGKIAFSVDLGNYFNVPIKYELRSYSLEEPMTGTMYGNKTFYVPAGYLYYKFMIEGDEFASNFITVPGGGVDQKTYAYNKYIEDGADNSLQLYVYCNKSASIPTFILNPAKGTDLLGEKNKYGDKVSITCTVSNGSNAYSQEFTDDSSLSVPETGSWEIVFKINAKNEHGDDVSEKYDLIDMRTGHWPGETMGYQNTSYRFFNLAISRDDS
ncbi:MAG: hypothetical protein ACI4SL_02665 [Candidatus Ornithospirochaeta sp.]